MKFFFGIFSVLVATIGVREASKIEIFEIRENENGLTVKNMNSNPRPNNQGSDSLIKLLRNPVPPDNQATKFAKQLLNKLKTLRGEEKNNRYRDDAHIYIINGSILDEDSSYEEIFVDKTRGDSNIVKSNDKKDIRELLLQLLQPDRKVQILKRKKLPQTFKHQANLRTNVAIIEDRTVAPRNYDDEYEEIESQK